MVKEKQIDWQGIRIEYVGDYCKSLFSFQKLDSIQLAVLMAEVKIVEFSLLQAIAEERLKHEKDPSDVMDK